MSARRAFAIAASATFLLPFFVYLITLAPSVVLADSGELAYAVWQVAPAHPPGSPLYVLLGQAAKLLPGADLARSLNLLSAFYQAAAMAVLLETYRRLLLLPEVRILAPRAPATTKRSSRSQRRAATPEKVVTVDGSDDRLALLGALAGVMSLAFDRSIWRWAVVTEVYALHLLLFSLAILVTLWAAEGPSPARLFVAGLAQLLPAGNHLTAILFVPLLAGYLALRAGRPILKVRPLAALAAGWSIGASVWAALPLMAARNPVFNWGNVTSVERLLRHVSGWQYQVNLIWREPGVLRYRHLQENIDRLFLVMREQQWIVWHVAAAVGLLLLRRRQAGMLAAGVVAIDLAHALSYQIAEDWDAYLYPLWVVLGLGVAALVARGLARLRPKARIPGGLVATLLLAAVPLLTNSRTCNHAGFTLPEQMVRDHLDGLPQGSLLLTREWQFYAPCLYLQHVKGYRRDITVLDTELLRRSWYPTYIERIDPDLFRTQSDATAEFVRALGPFERNEGFDAQLLERLYHRILGGYLEARAGRAFVGPNMEEGVVPQGMRLVPRGLSFQLVPTAPRTLPPQPPLAGEEVIASHRYPDAEGIGKIIDLYGSMRLNRGLYLATIGERDAAIAEIERGMILDPADERGADILTKLSR